MIILRDAIAKIQRQGGTVNRPTEAVEESFPVYWETTSQIVTGSDGNELKSIAYGDFSSSSLIKKGDTINSVTKDGIELLSEPAIVKQIGVYTSFGRIEVFI